MGTQQLLVAGDGGGGGGGDPYFANVSLLLHMDGTNGSTSFVDSSANAFTVTAGGNAQLTTTSPKFGSAAGLFDGTTDGISIADNAALQMGTSDFTIETWVNSTNFTASACLFDKGRIGGNGIGLQLNATNGRMTATSGWSLSLTETTGTPATGTWYHLAMTRQHSASPNQTIYYLFRDGTQVASHTIAGASTNLSDASTLWIGETSSGVFSLAGNLDDYRITKGVCRYNANFTPPSAAFPDS